MTPFLPEASSSLSGPARLSMLRATSSHGLYGLGARCAKVSIVAAELGPIVAHVMQPGAWYGDSALARQPRTIGLSPTRDSWFFFLPTGEADAIVGADRNAWTHFMALAVGNADLAVGVGLDLMTRSPRKRCAATLLRLGGYRHTINLERDQPEIDVTQTELAQMANLLRNAAAAVLRDFRTSGFLEWTYKQIRLLKPQLLRQYVEQEPLA